jgi:hypothetical protein
MAHVVLLGISVATRTFRWHGVDVSSVRQLADSPESTANSFNSLVPETGLNNIYRHSKAFYAVC